MGLLVLWVANIPIASAAQTQWFPEPDMKCTYQVFAEIVWNNGTHRIGSDFNIYTYNGLNYIIPLVSDYISPEYAVELQKGEYLPELYLVHTYSEKSSTELLRNTSLSTKDKDFDFMPFDFSPFHNSGMVGRLYWDYEAATVQKTTFHNASDGSFPDYIDAQSTIDENASGNYQVTFNNGQMIHAVRFIDTFSNNSIVANETGKVISIAVSGKIMIAPAYYIIRFEYIEPPLPIEALSLFDRFLGLDWPLVGALL
jgi:hypothetical protein